MQRKASVVRTSGGSKVKKVSALHRRCLTAPCSCLRSSEATASCGEGASRGPESPGHALAAKPPLGPYPHPLALPLGLLSCHTGVWNVCVWNVCAARRAGSACVYGAFAGSGFVYACPCWRMVWCAVPGPTAGLRAGRLVHPPEIPPAPISAHTREDTWHRYARRHMNTHATHTDIRTDTHTHIHKPE